MIYELRRGGFALFLRINHSGTLYSQWDTGFSGFVGRDMFTWSLLYFLRICGERRWGFDAYAPTVEEAASSPDVPDHDNNAIASKSNPLEIDEIFASMFQGDI